jgi:hypothetical protein
MISPADFFDTIAQVRTPALAFDVRLAMVQTAAGRPTLKFDGETLATTLAYPYLASYTPTIGDRVLVIMLNGSGVVLGKVV